MKLNELQQVSTILSILIIFAGAIYEAINFNYLPIIGFGIISLIVLAYLLGYELGQIKTLKQQLNC